MIRYATIARHACPCTCIVFRGRLLMKIAVGSDERTHLTDALIDELKKRGHELTLFGSIAENDPEVD